MSMKLIARSRAPFFKLCGKRALLSLLCAPREFQGNSPAKGQAAARVDAFRSFLYDESVGRLAQLVRAPALQAGGRRFEPCTAHHPCAPPFRGDVVQLVRTLPSRWLESHTVTAWSLAIPDVPAIVFKHLHESSCLLRTNLTPQPAPVLKYIMCVHTYVSAAVAAAPRLRTSRRQEPIVDPVCPADSYLIKRRATSVSEIKCKAAPKRPSPGYDRLFATLARGGL